MRINTCKNTENMSMRQIIDRLLLQSYRNSLFSYRRSWDEKGTHLEEEIDGQEDYHESEGVACGGDDGSKNEKNNDGVATIGAEEVTVQHAQVAQQPSHQW